jgi:hypothetical protein
MDSLTQDYPALVRTEYRTPCLSLYQPTHRRHPDNEQDPIRFRNLLRKMQAALQVKHSSREIAELLQPFEALADDLQFWNHAGDGLAVLGAPGFFRAYKLHRPVAELVIVADSFHTKPLMRIVQSADRFQVLGLDSQSYKVYEGNRDALDELAPIDSGKQALAGDQEPTPTERERGLRTYGPAGHGRITQHGVDVKQDADDNALAAFFRWTDQMVLEHRSRPSGLPLILAALPEHHHLFRSISRNPFLMSEAIDVNPGAMSIDTLRERAWQLMQPVYLERLGRLVDAFGAAVTNGRGSDALDRIGESAVAGRIDTLLIEADRILPGRIDANSGRISAPDPTDPRIDDVLDDLGETVLRNGGNVVVVPAESMPTDSGAAAIYRY